MPKVRPLIKIHGGKYYLCDWIIQNFPPNYHELDYVEPFIGGGSVFLNMGAARSYHLNDIDDQLIDLWESCTHLDFVAYLRSLSYNEETFTKYRDGPVSDDWEYPIQKFVVSRMSRGGLGKTFAWSNRLRGGIPGDVNAWNTSIDNIEYKIAPLLRDRRPTLTTRSAPTLIASFFLHKSALVYCDPPYLHKTRKTKADYKYEMSEADHKVLLDILCQCKGKVLISGYESTLYNRTLKNWNRIDLKVKCNADQSKKKSSRTECLWKNF